MDDGPCGNAKRQGLMGRTSCCLPLFPLSLLLFPLVVAIIPRMTNALPCW